MTTIHIITAFDGHFKAIFRGLDRRCSIFTDLIKKSLGGGSQQSHFARVILFVLKNAVDGAGSLKCDLDCFSAGDAREKSKEYKQAFHDCEREAKTMPPLAQVNFSWEGI
jgi:hypothetical protein